MFRLSESLHGSVLKTNDAEPRVLLKFVKRAAGRKVLTLDVELLARLLETKPDQHEVVRIPGEVCVTPSCRRARRPSATSAGRASISSASARLTTSSR